MAEVTEAKGAAGEEVGGTADSEAADSGEAGETGEATGVTEAKAEAERVAAEEAAAG